MPDPKSPRRSFASDNNAGVHPEIVEAIRTVNEGHVVAYGDDDITARTVKLFKKHFGKDVEVYLCFRRHGSEHARTESDHATVSGGCLCRDGHINVDECGAPEKFTGCKLLAQQTQMVSYESSNRTAGARLRQRASRAAARRVDLASDGDGHRLHEAGVESDRQVCACEQHAASRRRRAPRKCSGESETRI
jgi:hypothetical protein